MGDAIRTIDEFRRRYGLITKPAMCADCGKGEDDMLPLASDDGEKVCWACMFSRTFRRSLGQSDDGESRTEEGE